MFGSRFSAWEKEVPLKLRGGLAWPQWGWAGGGGLGTVSSRVFDVHRSRQSHTCRNLVNDTTDVTVHREKRLDWSTPGAGTNADPCEKKEKC